MFVVEPLLHLELPNSIDMWADRYGFHEATPYGAPSTAAGGLMPIVEVTMSTGRSPETVRTLMTEVHNAVASALGAPTPSIRVIVHEVPPEHWSSDGITLAESAAAAAR